MNASLASPTTLDVEQPAAEENCERAEDHAPATLCATADEWFASCAADEAATPGQGMIVVALAVTRSVSLGSPRAGTTVAARAAGPASAARIRRKFPRTGCLLALSGDGHANRAAR